MSQLLPLLAKLKDSGAERVFFAPGEVGSALNGEVRSALGGGPVEASRILAAVAEVLSQDELGDLPTNRPRIVRHEHGGDEYVLEVVRQEGGIALGIRFAAPRPMRTPTYREPGRDPARDSVREAPAEPAPFSSAGPEAAAEPEQEAAAVAPVRVRAPKRTVRVELDDEGNPVDSVAIALSLPRFGAVRPAPAPAPVPPAPAPAPAPIAAEGAGRIVATMIAIDPLADLPRTGWLLRGVRPCESIAEHSFGVAFLAMLLVDAIRANGGTIDGELTLRMALVHDAAEAMTGDIPMPQKTPRMTEALHELEATLVRTLLPARQLEVWTELERGDSTEASVVAAADKAQMMIKAMIYERQRRGDLQDFWANPKNFDDCGLTVARELFEAIGQAAGRQLPKR